MSLLSVAALIQHIQWHVQHWFLLALAPMIKTEGWHSYTEKVLSSFYASFVMKAI